MTDILFQSLLLTLAIVSGLWVLSLVLRDASIADPFWGTGFVVISWFAIAQASAADITPRGWLLVALTTVWGLRLSLYLLLRNRTHGEDRRYRAMREHHGTRFWWVSLGTVFWLQGGLMWFISLPIQVAVVTAAERSLSWIDAVGVGIWLAGLFFEGVGDYQMARFQAEPANAGRVMDRGLWRYTRHPNYFGDFCVWWGLYLISAAGGAGATILSPIVMSWLLLQVSGVSLLERTISSRRPDYEQYRQRTNAFFPGPPRRPRRPAGD